jgi:hypothetical protein
MVVFYLLATREEPNGNGVSAYGAATDPAITKPKQGAVSDPSYSLRAFILALTARDSKLLRPYAAGRALRL